MKAIAVHPGKPGSIHLEDVPRPSIDEIGGGRGVLVRVLRVGVDGTDKEITAGEYGAAPPGEPAGLGDGDALLLLRVLLGIEPDGDQLRLDPHLPEPIRRIELTAIPGRWGPTDVTTHIMEEVR